MPVIHIFIPYYEKQTVFSEKAQFEAAVLPARRQGRRISDGVITANCAAASVFCQVSAMVITADAREDQLIEELMQPLAKALKRKVQRQSAAGAFYVDGKPVRSTVNPRPVIYGIC